MKTASSSLAKHSRSSALRQGARLGFALLTAVSALFSGGCYTDNYTLKTHFDSVPIKSETNMTRALQCMKVHLDKKPADNAYMFLVRNMRDGTIKDTQHIDGPLADAGRHQMISTLADITNPRIAAVTDTFPLMFKTLANENIGLNRFGLPAQQNLRLFSETYSRHINLARQRAGAAPVPGITPLIVDGAFTRFDSAFTDSKGYGQNGGYRGTDNNQVSVHLDFGESGTARSLTLVVNIIDPSKNIIIGTQSFELLFYQNSKKARFRVAFDEFYYGFSHTDVVVETVHAAQQVLLEAAAIWILDNAFGRSVDLTPCFSTPEEKALGLDSRTPGKFQFIGNKDELLSAPRLKTQPGFTESLPTDDSLEEPAGIDAAEDLEQPQDDTLEIEAALDPYESPTLGGTMTSPAMHQLAK